MSRENVEIVRRVFRQWARGDLAAHFLDADIEYSRIGAQTPDMEGRWIGLDEMSARYATMGSPCCGVCEDQTPCLGWA